MKGVAAGATQLCRDSITMCAFAGSVNEEMLFKHFALVKGC